MSHTPNLTTLPDIPKPTRGILPGIGKLVGNVAAGFTTFVFFLVVLMQSPQVVLAQPSTVSLYTHFGYIAQHSSDMAHLAQSHIVVVQADAVFPQWLSRPWANTWHRPDVGLSALFANLNNPSVLGNITGLGVYAEPWILKSRRHRLSYRISTGLGYSPVVFDKDNNRTNVLYSSRFNCLMQGQLKYTCMLTDRFGINAGLGLTHFSNGAFNLPNFGINLLTANLGVRYEINASKQSLNLHNHSSPDTLPTYTPNWKLQASAAMALVDIEPGGSKKYPYYIASLLMARRIGIKSTLNFGAEIFYNTALKDVVRIPDTTHFSGPFGRVGLVAGHEMHFSKISLLTQLGYYAYKKTPIDAPIYFRVGLRYYVSPMVFAGVCLKTHYASADCIEWTLGANLWRQKK